MHTFCNLEVFCRLSCVVQRFPTGGSEMVGELHQELELLFN